MALQGQRPLSEYHLFTGPLSIATAAMGFLPIPAAGQIVKITACVDAVIAGADTDLTFQLANVNLTSGGATATMTLTTAGSAVGDIFRVDLDPNDKINFALESVDLEAAATGGTLEIISDASGTGTVALCVTIRR